MARFQLVPVYFLLESINFKGHDGYQDTTVTNIIVDSMRLVQVPTITLHK